MNMYDAWGDGWNGGTYSIVDDLDGTVYASGGLAAGSSGTDNFCANLLHLVMTMKLLLLAVVDHIWVKFLGIF
jgi:hypothetical protein